MRPDRVQDLTNPMLAQVPHVLLGAHAGTIMGVESNGMQFYPEASTLEARAHPRYLQSPWRRSPIFPLSYSGAGFGYQVERIQAEAERVSQSGLSLHCLRSLAIVTMQAERPGRSSLSGKVDFPLVGSFRATGVARVLPGLLLACPFLFSILPSWVVVSGGPVHRDGVVDYSQGSRGHSVCSHRRRRFSPSLPSLELPGRYFKLRPLWVVLGLLFFSSFCILNGAFSVTSCYTRRWSP